MKQLRFHIFRIFFYLGLMALGAGLFQTQVIQGERYRTISDKNRIRVIPLEAPRGRVFDRFHRLLVTNRASYDVVATLDEIQPASISMLSKLLDLSVDEIENRMKATRESRFAPAIIEEDIPKELAFEIEQRKPELPGIMIRVSSLRHYPYRETASHIIGYIGKINEREYRTRDHERYGMNSYVGRAGLERIYDEDLRGWRGGRQIEVNARGDLVKVLSEKFPEPGRDLTISIDLEFQKKIMELIKDDHAAVAVLDLKNDELLALASNPAFDPNTFVQPGRGKDRMKLIKDKAYPLINRAVAAAYPPGSVFKLVTALAGLETGKIKPKTRFYCNGEFRLSPRAKPAHCWYKQGHGSLNLYEALERSCNVYFFNVAARLKPEDIARYARELGLGERMQLELTNIAPGLVPDTAWKSKKFKDKWYQGETLSFAIGQGYLLTTPIQILRLTAILAKNGKRVDPKIVLDGKKNSIFDTGHVEIQEANIQVIKKGMLQVVQSPYGTGQMARVNFAKFAAKTGTAQAPPHKSHGWMTGFFPYEKPRIAFMVFVEHGGSGGIVAARIVKDMLKIWREMYASEMV